ncbi:MAG: hypothetical protein H6Q17_1182 [Bacteroidetes bacterium]|nr:hypothetical protein [Bacteroidota bacterium]
METDLQLIDNIFVDVSSKDDKIRYSALQTLLTLTENKVDWVYDKWYDLVDKLESDNSYQRSIGFMLLANLSKSDADNRMHEILKKMIQLFDDEKFITSRQCIQNIWKIAIGNSNHKVQIMAELQKTYYENAHINKHGNLIKQDVIFSMNKIYQSDNDNNVLLKIHALIDAETDAKFVKVLKKILL